MKRSLFLPTFTRAPNDVVQQAAFFKKLSKQLEEFAQDTIVIGGDFNCALTSKDKKGGISTSKKSPVIEEIETLCHLYNLSDIWRNLNPDEQCFTWRTKSFKMQCRLDYFLVSQELTPSTKKCDILYATESDHSAVSIHLQSLYQSSNINTTTFENSPFFNPENITTLNDVEKESCEGLLNEEECANALKDLSNNKTPGTDGLPAEFYRFFWPDIRHDLLASYNYAFQHGTISISQIDRRGIISLILKKSKDKTILENLRPISLLNVDYKILTKVISKRIEKVLPVLINPDLTGYVKGRHIGEN